VRETFSRDEKRVILLSQYPARCEMNGVNKVGVSNGRRVR